MKRTIPIACALVVLVGCAGVRRPYQAPVMEAPAAWSRTPTTEPEAAVDTQALSQWWTVFGDEELTSLVDRAVSGSLDLRTAASRLREARANLKGTRSNLRPTVNATGSASFSDTGSAASGVQRLYQAGLRCQLGTGRVRRNTQPD